MRERLVAGFRAAHGRDPEILARAPGRIEFIGNHTDYNGGLVLGASIDRTVWVALARRNDGRRRFMAEGQIGCVELAVEATGKQDGPRSWVNYPLGILVALGVFGIKAPSGFDYLAISDLPVGAGLSSSAAIELASALAFVEAAGASVPRETLVKIGRHAENHFVGVPCGILDQGVSGFGLKDHLVFIDCRGPRFDTVDLPGDSHFWIFNTHTKHALVDGLYAERHRECMEAARVLGVELLVDATAAALANAESRLAPATFKRARHIIEEIARVREAVAALGAGDLKTVGLLLNASHRSSKLLFENSTEQLDFLAEHLASLESVYGARLTGGGFGGAVMALTSSRFDDAAAARVAAAYSARFGADLEILHAQTADGASLIN